MREDMIELAMLAGTGAEAPDEVILEARVESSSPESCRFYLFSDPKSGGDVRSTLLRGQDGSTIRARVRRDHSLVDDLYAVGTMWIASLLASPTGFEAAAQFRDELAPRLRNTSPGGGITLIQESLKAATTSRKFDIRSAGLMGGAGDSRTAPVEEDLLAKALALGMRLCGAVPAGYPCQHHEPTDRENRERVYEMLLSIVTELSRETRERLLGTGTVDHEILGALGDYALERSSGEKPKPKPKRRKTSWTRISGGGR